MILIVRKRRGIVKKRWKVGTVGPISIVKIGVEGAMCRSGAYLWVPWLEFVVLL